MPKSRRHHPANIATPWFDNLLPDNDAVREKWSASFGERQSTPFTLLQHMGSDCAGAVQVLPEGTEPDTDAGHRTVDDAEIEQRLRILRRDETAWAARRWSLGGAQGKFALALTSRGRWVEPTGRSASAHIFKVGPHGARHGSAAEYLTMRTARHIGLATATTELRRFGGEYRFRSIGPRPIERAASDIGVDPAWFVGDTRTMAARLPTAVDQALADVGPELDATVAENFRRRIVFHVDQARNALH